MKTRHLLFILLLFNLLGNISCKKEENSTPDPEKIIIGRGPEDMVLDSANGNVRILASCNERNDANQPFSEIMSYDITSKAVSTLSRIGMPESIDFNPHGFYLQIVDGKKYLYIVNHYKDGRKINSIVLLELIGDELHFRKEYRSELMISPNEVCALPNGSFYFTNDMGSDDFVYEQLLNKFGGSVVYCDNDGNCKYAEEKLAFPNGLEYKDGQLFLATTRNYGLFRYDIEADGSLLNKTKINSINGMDNIRWYGNQLIVAVHPDEIAFVKHSTDEKYYSPSWIYSIDIATGDSKLLYKNGGWEISASSTALIYGDYLYISQVFGNFLLKVKI